MWAKPRVRAVLTRVTASLPELRLALLGVGGRPAVSIFGPAPGSGSRPSNGTRTVRRDSVWLTASMLISNGHDDRSPYR